MIENGVYLTDAQSAQIKMVTIDDTGATTTISSRLGAPTEQDVTVNYGSDAAALQAYNTKNGTDYQLLPEKYYSFSETRSTIKAGEVSSAPVDLVIQPFDEEIDVSKKYAIPVVIVSAEGVDRLVASSSLMILIDQVIVTTVPYLSSQIVNYVFSDYLQCGSWTLEWMICKDEYTRQFVNQWDVNDVDNKMAIHSKIGDVDAELNQFKVNIRGNKPKSVSRFVANKWYHLALVYDGVNIKFYVDGLLDFSVPHVNPNEIFLLKDFSFGKNSLRGYINELRVWSVARTPAEIKNNMYTVFPKTLGLEIYWKCNDGSGNILHDYSGNGRDGVLSSTPIWKSGVRFPDTEE